MKDRMIANQIAGINDLKMVRFYRLYGEEGPMHGLMAYYQDQLINLCNADKHFMALVERIVNVYDRERQTREILIDPTTRQILQTAGEVRMEALEEGLAAYEECTIPLIAPRAFSAVYLLPIVKYVLQGLYGGKLVFDELDRQWFGKGYMDAMNGEKRLHFPYQIEASAGEVYDIVVRNVSAYGNLLKIEITYGYDRITAAYYDTYYKYEGSLQYTMIKNKALITHELCRNGERIFLTETEGELQKDAVPEERIRKLTAENEKCWSAYRLPWGDIVYAASVAGLEHRVMVQKENAITISYGLGFRYLTGDELPLVFGEYAFRLYERADLTELHMIEMEQPGSGRYQERYEGKVYKSRF